MRILVIGGAGYIGSELVKRLAKSDNVEEVTVYDNLSRENFNFFLSNSIPQGGKIKFLAGELLDSRKLKKSLEGVEAVYHLAAKVTTPFANTDSHSFEQVNHWGTAEVVYAIEESDIKKFFYISSASVYGSSNRLITESDNPNPKTFYGISKLRGEEHVYRLMDKINTCIFRSGNVYGYSPSMRFDAVINRFMFDANFNNRISIHGNGKQHRAFIHIDLIAKALNDILLADVPSGIYNVVDRNLQILDIVDVLKEIFPDLEFLFINQHLNLREMRVDPDSKLRSYVDYSNPKSLKEELVEFKKRFSF